jgi:hypothetical protein
MERRNGRDSPKTPKKVLLHLAGQDTNEGPHSSQGSEFGFSWSSEGASEWFALHYTNMTAASSVFSWHTPGQYQRYLRISLILRICTASILHHFAVKT